MSTLIFITDIDRRPVTMTPPSMSLVDNLIRQAWHSNTEFKAFNGSQETLSKTTVDRTAVVYFVSHNGYHLRLQDGVGQRHNS